MCKNSLSPETVRFIAVHRHDDVRLLALQAGRYPDVDMSEAVVQIAGWQIAEKKIPLWAQTEGIRYPRHLSMEQCSSELTARYKASLVEGGSLTDLTGGFGVDFSFLARQFKTACYVERQEALCCLAQHNFPILGLNDAQICHNDGVDFLNAMQPVDCIFLDPARRDGHGGKTIAIADCEPDVSRLEDLLLSKARTVMVKLSPMLDIASAVRDLRNIYSLHVVAVHNECKELIALLKRGEKKPDTAPCNPIITCSQLVNNPVGQQFSFRLSDEQAAACSFAEKLGDYLYEPGASLLKAGPYRLLSERYGIDKLHPNSHLYTSDKLIDFPGRRFRIDAQSGFSKQELKTFLQGVANANLTVRNFPMNVADLRKKLKLKEGGDVYIFATTLQNGERTLIKCHRILVP